MRKFLAICLVILAACLIRFWNLDKVDLSVDEMHYVNDAFRLVNRDPYISIRHHPFRHAQGSIGHPFLSQIITGGIFKAFGESTFTSRLTQALAGIFTVVVVLLFNKKLGGRVAFFGALLLAISPFLVRYNHTAYLDSLFTFLLTAVAVSVWRYHQSANKAWLVVAGLACGLAVSTKIDGVISLVLALLLLLFAGESICFSFRNLKEVGSKFMLVLVPMAIIAFLLNDPRAYLDGIINPTDPHYNFLSQAYLGKLKSLGGRLLPVFYYLLSPGILMASFISLILIVREKSRTAVFLLIWLISLSGIIFLHVPGASGEYGWMPIIPPLTMILSYELNKLTRGYSRFILLFLVITAVPFIYLYGLRISPLPYIPIHNRFLNRTASDNFYQGIITMVNTIVPRGGKVFLLPPADYPVFFLKSGTSWTYYEDLSQFDVLVVSDPTLIAPVSHQVKLIEKVTGYEDGVYLERYIYEKKE